MIRILSWIDQAGKKRRLNIAIGSKLGKLLEMEGVANVKVQKITIPMGDWGGRSCDFYVAYGQSQWL